MIQRPFRDHHLLCLLQAYENQQYPLDLFISQYFRANKALGSKDRGAIAETAYAMTRWQGLLDYLCEKPVTWEKRFAFFEKFKIEDYDTEESIPAHIRCSFPKHLYDLIVKSHGEEGHQLCRISNSPAPTTVRINPNKTTREAMLKRWQEVYSVSPCDRAEYGIIFHKKINFFSLPEFQEGLFEVQDEGSQLLSDLVKVQPGQLVMDYCAGSGGKSLAFAHRMKGTGQIFLHDVRSHALMEGRKRLRRAGIQNAQSAAADDPKLKRLKKKMDWVLVDAPCSGTGTMRRNPDMKWKFDENTLKRLVGQQRTIFEKALSFVNPKEGRIVYSTCSILQEENEEQLAHFLKTYNLSLEEDKFQTLPSNGGMDGFYGVVLKFNSVEAST